MQRDTLNAKLKDIYMNHRDRLDVAMAADDICTAITNGEQVKGLYLSIWHLKYLVAYDEM
jgi:primosomal protein DnaI